MTVVCALASACSAVTASSLTRPAVSSELYSRKKGMDQECQNGQPASHGPRTHWSDNATEPVQAHTGSPPSVQRVWQYTIIGYKVPALFIAGGDTLNSEPAATGARL
jgi:hypothetical protein